MGHYTSQLNGFGLVRSGSSVFIQQGPELHAEHHSKGSIQLTDRSIVMYMGLLLLESDGVQFGEVRINRLGVSYATSSITSHVVSRDEFRCEPLVKIPIVYIAGL